MALRLGRPYGWGVSDDGRTREFLDRFAVTPVAPERYTGTCHPAWPGRAFGGQLAAQSVQAAAAALTDESLHPWSLHILFHAPVASNSRIDYQVLALKEGRTLTSRQVRVEQDGKLRATAVVLFGMTAEGPEHQYQQPDAPPPALVPPEERLIDPTLVAPDADFEELGYPAESLVDLRIVERAERGPADNSAETSDGYLRKAWMRVIPDLPDDPITAAATLCYLSDITQIKQRELALARQTELLTSTFEHMSEGLTVTQPRYPEQHRLRFQVVGKLAQLRGVHRARMHGFAILALGIGLAAAQ